MARVRSLPDAVVARAEAANASVSNLNTRPATDVWISASRRMA